MNPDTINASGVATTQPATATAPPASTPGAIGSLLGAGAQHFVRTELTLRKEEAAWSAGNLARMARQAAEQLRQQDQEPVAQITERAAARLERASTYLHQTPLDQIVTDLEDFARHQPAIFIAGSLILGLAAARFIKSTAQPSQP
jgi:hypothetical protein